MNQDDALRLFHSNAIILITNLPTFSSNSSTSSTSNSSSSLSLEFGLDFHSWQTGPKFKGVKFIPPGLHLFHYSVINKHGNEGARTSTASSSMGGGGGGGGVVGRSGVFKTFEPGEIFVCEWMPDLECIQPLKDEEQAERLRKNIFEFDKFLGSFPLDIADSFNVKSSETSLSPRERWTLLTSHITPSTLSRILPPGLHFNSLSSTSFHSDILLKEERDASNGKQQQQQTQQLIQADSNSGDQHMADRLQFTGPINLKRSFPPPPSPNTTSSSTLPTQSYSALVTKYSIDKSYLLRKTCEDIARKESCSKFSSSSTSSIDMSRLIGEFQLSFIIFLLGQVYDGFEQWKLIICLVCNCEEVIADHAADFAMFVDSLKFQLQDAPSDLFYEIMAIANGGSGGGEGGEPSSTHTTRKQPQQQNFLEISVSKLIENVKFVHRDLFSLSSPLPSTTKGKLDLSLPIFNLLERCDEFARFLQDKFGWVVVNSSIRSDDEDEEAAMQFCNENDEGINVVSHSGIDMSRFIPATDRDEMGDVGFGRWATAGGNEDNDVDDGNDNDNDESIMECDDDDE